PPLLRPIPPAPNKKITKRTHLSFFKMPANTADSRHWAGASGKNEPIQAIQKPFLSSLSARHSDWTVSESRISLALSMLNRKEISRLGLLLVLAGILPFRLFAQGTVFTYQGMLNDQGARANGSY